MGYMILLVAVFAVYACLSVPPGNRLPYWAKAVILYVATMTAGTLMSGKFDEWTPGSDDILIGC